MAKKKKEDSHEESEIEIKSASIKDGFCNYSYDIVAGIGKGDTHTVKGVGIIMKDLEDAFKAFNPHLAAIDDVFKHNNIQPRSFDKLINHELTAMYQVTGFKIKGSEENLTIVLIGNKKISCSGELMELETPRIPLQLSSYKWAEELEKAAAKAQEEVELYREGKCEAVEEEEDGNQLTIESNGSEDELENARV